MAQREAGTPQVHGGTLVAEVLARHDVRFLFTLCGGHISPILLGCEGQGIRVIDVRHEATAVFAADAVARLTGTVGVAAVTAGPGVTNTITALKNAQMAQSPVVLLGGATATLLTGRGALQDIDQMALVRPHVKWATMVDQLRDIGPALETAIAKARAGVPGPVFVELPVDLLYPQAVVNEWYAASTPGGSSLRARLMRWYMARHQRGLFNGNTPREQRARPVAIPNHDADDVADLLDSLARAQRPVLLIGSQALLPTEAGAAQAQAEALQQAVLQLGVPAYLSGMARGLLGRHALHLRHKRSKALKEADLIVLAGVPCDFRLGYGRSLGRDARLVMVNRSRDELKLNCRPDQAILADAGAFLRAAAAAWQGDAGRWAPWISHLQARDAERDGEIVATSGQETEFVNPVALCRELEAVIPEESVIIGDGGDFVATASYIVRPRGPLSWLDPGAFGTLGAGAGFALGAKLARPEAEVWLLYGDGSAAYSIAEFDTFNRHNVPVIAIVGTDGSWAQIAREQVAIFDNALGTELARTAYQTVAEGYGAAGLLLREPGEMASCLREAQRLAASGKPVLLNAWIGATDFRKGSISM
ncbi:MAG: thiamine pyrophosphate-binding protein [Anaerolineae bacterium]|nr:thiamine pyrophosphate-binding protein [Anaerolineae bacterium]